MFMNNLPTLSKAKKDVTYLQEFIFLVENYEESTLYQKIIRRYAITGSINQVVLELNAEREMEGLLSIDRVYALEVITSKPKDQLHRLIRTKYMNKTRHNRSRFR